MGGASLQYAMSTLDTSISPFVIDSSTGQLTVEHPSFLNYENISTYSIVVTAEDISEEEDHSIDSVQLLSLIIDDGDTLLDLVVDMEVSTTNSYSGGTQFTNIIAWMVQENALTNK